RDLGPPIPEYSPATSIVVIAKPCDVRLATCAAAGLPARSRNWPFHRSMLASTVPPWPGPKKYTAHSALVCSAIAGATTYVAARMGLAPSFFQPRGAVIRSLVPA